MKDGFIKVAAVTTQIKVADCGFNASGIIEAMKKASGMGVKLCVFPELCVSGYTCGDLFFQCTLIDGVTGAIGEIVKASEKLDMLTVVGAPLLNNLKLYNCALFIYKGEILGVVPKTYIPDYAEFNETRYFAPAPEEVSTINVGGKEYPFGTNLIFRDKNMPSFAVAAEICEDLHTPHPTSSYHATAGATVIVNLSASNEIVGKQDFRRMLVKSQSARCVAGYVYANAGEGESTTDLVFGGHNIICEMGDILAESNVFETGITVSEIDVNRLAGERGRITTFDSGEDVYYEYIDFDMKQTETKLTRCVAKLPFVPSGDKERQRRCEDILKIASNGLKKRIEHTNCRSLVIGISGGLDSTLALITSCRAMKLLNRDVKDIIAVTMPCFGTTERTKSNAEILCESLGVTLRTVDIAKTVKSHFEDIGHDKDNFDVVFENAQARERTQILMDIANQMGGLVIGTGDLSELALGWATYNGDHMSMYGVNGSVPKTLVRHIVAYSAQVSEDNELKKALLDILATPVSPELLPPKDGEISQQTEEIVGPYELHDFFMYYAVRYSFSPAKIYRLCKYAFGDEYDGETIKKWLETFFRRFFSQQFKRSCLPDGPKVGSVTLSPRGDWNMPSDASSALWMNEIKNL